MKSIFRETKALKESWSVGQSKDDVRGLKTISLEFDLDKYDVDKILMNTKSYQKVRGNNRLLKHIALPCEFSICLHVFHQHTAHPDEQH